MTDKTEFDLIDKKIRERVANEDLVFVENALGLPRTAFTKLIDEPSDWGFVIKVAIILEAALTQTIAAHLDTPELQKHLSRLPVGGRTGKIQLAIDLNAIDQRTAKRLHAISALRNIFAHDVSVINLSLEKHVDALPLSERQRIAADLLDLGQGTKKPTQFTGLEARHVIWVSALLCLIHFSNRYRENENTLRWRNARIIMGEALLAKQQGDINDYKSKLVDALKLLEGRN